MRRALALSVLAVTLWTAQAQADLIRLKNGRQVVGEIVEETDTYVTMRFASGEGKFHRSQIVWAIRGSEESIHKKVETARHFKEGQKHFEDGIYSLAALSFERAATLEPGHAGILSNLGSAYARSGQASKAVEVLEEAHHLEPENETVTQNLVNALSTTGDHRRAAALLHSELDGSNDPSDLYMKLAIVFKKGLRYTQSKKLYFEALTHGAVPSQPAEV